LTVEYERARWPRPAHGDRDGAYNAGASKTVAVPPDRRRARWASDHFGVTADLRPFA
jgi:hypothetical protein